MANISGTSGTSMCDVLMPQMGESVTEGTVVRWIRRVGEHVDHDEPLFEISTDKVDAEIPAPAAGILLRILVGEGETVPVNSVVAVIGAAGDDVGGHLSALGSPSDDDLRGGASATMVPAPRAELEPSGSGDSQTRTSAPVHGLTPDAVEERRRRFSSPLVRKIAAEHGIDIMELTGTGISGRVTRHDITAFLERRPTSSRPVSGGAGLPAFSVEPGPDDRVEKLSVMRRKIAEHMVASVRTSPHVYSAYEVDFSRVDALRQAHKARFEAEGTRLTYTSFIARAVAMTIREFPVVNASLDGDRIIYRHEINVGMAVALEQGLIVPVIRHADERSMLDLCRTVQDLAERARTKRLKVEDVEGGTFTITNAGVFGGLWGLPIINQPQVAILAVGSIEKRAVVVDDAIVIRPMCYLTMGFDHRLVDGADGGRFLQALKRRLEHFEEHWLEA